MAIQTTDPDIRDFLVEKQAEWAADSRTTTVETNKKWFTYAVAVFPRGLNDFHGNTLDSGSVVNDEIEIQTGLKPVDVRPFQLRNTGLYLATTRLPLLTKADRHRQCKTHWDYPSFGAFHKRPPCWRCGKTGYAPDDCIAPEQCVNCIGPHRASLHKCPARPKSMASFADWPRNKESMTEQ
uniref:CCHC-type domain-containing protein n=1 Tax=Fusarium oxysporum (strain Fo5176) TaxID=660025 RepID=A0A0D2YJK8_FUSOF